MNCPHVFVFAGSYMAPVYVQVRSDMDEAVRIVDRRNDLPGALSSPGAHHLREGSPKPGEKPHVGRPNPSGEKQLGRAQSAPRSVVLCRAGGRIGRKSDE